MVLYTETIRSTEELMILRGSRHRCSEKSLLVPVSQELKLCSHSIKFYREVFILHLQRKNFLQIFNFSFFPHYQYSDDLVFVIGRSKKRKSLHVIPMKM